MDTETNGGALQLIVEAEPVPPPPEVTLTVDPVGAFDRGGNAIVSGTFTCTGEAEFVGLGGEVRQQVGRFAVLGWFDLHEHEETEPSLACDGTTQHWTATVRGETGLFRGGSATVQAFGFACGFFDCSESEVSAQIKLRRLR